MEQFSLECQIIIGFALTALDDWIKKLAPLQSEVNKNQSRLVCALFSALCVIHTLRFDWFSGLSGSQSVLAKVITLVFVSRQSVENQTNLFTYMFHL